MNLRNTNLDTQYYTIKMLFQKLPLAVKHFKHKFACL